MNIKTSCPRFLILSSLLLLAGCGGSGGGTSSTPGDNTVAKTTVTGSVFAGPTNGASVTVKTADGTTVAGPATTAADGSYTIDIPNSALSSDLVFEASGGTYTDEAVPTSTVPLTGLAAHIAGGSLGAGSNISIDPASTIIRKLIAGGMTRSAAETAFNSAFGYVPDTSVRPAFTNLSTASTTAQRLAGVRAAAFSQLTKNMGLPPEKQFELIQALADDLANGSLDGKDKDSKPVKTASGTDIPEDAGNRFMEALTGFQSGSGNKSRLTVTQLGPVPFNKVAVTPSYRIEYVPGAAPAAMGRTDFKLKLTNRSDGLAATGKTVTIRPYMFMATKSHATPADVVTEDGNGYYSCIIYPVMSSSSNGVVMGLWQLKVSVGGEEATFYPDVAAVSGITPLAKLTGISDSIAGAAGPEKRTWFVFKDSLAAGTAGHDFGFFLATKESMENFPAVKTGDQLKDASGAAWTVTAIAVQVSTDGTTWVNAVENGNGHWTATGLTGLTAGTSGKIYLKLTVNGEQKTTNGNALAADGSNGFQTFTVLP